MAIKNKVLVVDDEPRNVKLLNTYLKAEGYHLLSAYDGVTAIKTVIEEQPDVILLDIMMPELNGFEVTELLKKHHKTQHIPIILVTSLDGAENRAKGLNVGADEFLTKPINRSELLARVRALQRLKSLHEELNHRRHIISSLTDMDSQVEMSTTSVLLVEDDANLCKHIRTILNSINISCVCVPSASVARTYLEHNKTDLILLDRLLPDGDGIQLMQEIIKNDGIADCPIIIITAVDDLKLKVEGIELGADDYLVKPVESNELKARIKAGLRRAHAIKQLKKDLEKAVSSTVTDPLTGVRNRYYLDADLEYRVAQAKRTKDHPLSIMMIDIDKFKAINDNFGHLIGDEVLCQVAKLLLKNARSADIVTRYGGEEFCVVMPDTDLEDAVSLANRMCHEIGKRSFKSLGDKKVTISLGVAEFQAQDSNRSALIKRADDALYEAKSTGRNKVCQSIGPSETNCA